MDLPAKNDQFLNKTPRQLTHGLSLNSFRPMTKLSSSPWHGITVTHRIWKSTEQEELLDEISELMKVTDDATEDA